MNRPKGVQLLAWPRLRLCFPGFPCCISSLSMDWLPPKDLLKWLQNSWSRDSSRWNMQRCLHDSMISIWRFIGSSQSIDAFLAFFARTSETYDNSDSVAPRLHGKKPPTVTTANLSPKPCQLRVAQMARIWDVDTWGNCCWATQLQHARHDTCQRVVAALHGGQPKQNSKIGPCS